ncbi:MAG: molybdopterin-synthase adenylyltransferase MoeB [Candidatus Dadabacteria bacterium]|nr:MAG: molybdopterin-synthase adenylyltransferase MoeB [Candidatus Dadabacteria bacterium]TDJ01962.1 MAG: molybdopterin-synthase adenylyltransferase MoeB [Candidatus Dadabacteria bacterium]
MLQLTEDQIYRYSRHILLPEVGGVGQRKLLDSKVFCVGVGGLGSPVALYLAAAGVGTVGIADSDQVDISNLQRQVLHYTDDIGKPKTRSAQEKLKKLNPDVEIIAYNNLITKDNIRDIIRNYDIVVDGSDNFPTRYLVNDACYFEKKTLISGAIFQFEGQISVFKPHNGGACYRCLYPEIPPEGMMPNCQEVGILGAVAGTVGTMQAIETLKEILEIGDSLEDRLLIFNALKMTFDSVKVNKYPQCHLCGENPSIKEVTEYKQPECDFENLPPS